MTQILRKFAMLACLSLPACKAQAPTKPTPQAAYQEAVRPFDLVRRDPRNWSEIEIAALKTAELTANASCLTRSPKEFEGDDLLAYARLCTFGRAWEPVELAAAKYIRTQPVPSGPGAAMRSLASAFDYEVQAALRLQKPVVAFRTCQQMLDTVPYDDLGSEAVDSAVPYLQLTNLDEALMVLHHRQAILLAMIRASAQTGVAQPLPLRTLYAEATALPAMQQYAGQPDAAAASYAELGESLPATLAPEDAASIADSRRRYALLGSHVPKIDTFAWLMDPAGRGIPPSLEGKFGSATVFLLFPDWCIQCVSMYPQFRPAWARMRQNDVRFFVLLAQAEAPPKSAPKESAKGTAKPGGVRAAPFAGESPAIPHNEMQLDVKPTAASLLAGSPAFAVPKKTLEDFVADDFPLVVVVDHDGIVRAMQVGNDTVLLEGGQIDQLVDHVVKQWPVPKP